MKIAVFPGSFDPITLGHMDIIRRAAACFDKLYVCVMVNCDKKCLFPMEKRLELIEKSIKDFPNVKVEQWDGLVAEYAQKKGADILVKGIRSAADLDIEIQMARINAGVVPGLETVFLPASAEYQHFSSTMAREMIRYGQPLEKYVPTPVAAELKK